MIQYDSIPAEEIRPQGDRQHWFCTLAELHPKEIAFFKQRFVWSSNKGGCYVRHRYEKIKIPFGPEFPKWCPLKTRGNWQHLYPDLVDSLVEKHLNFEKFYKLHSYKDRLSPNADETAFWLGTMAGEQTFNDCIDLDSHDQIGWNPVPTMWHSSRTGCMNGPYSWRHVPVIRPTLRFFQMAKVIYDSFRNRIWAFSSANFGLAVWKVYDQPELTHVVYRKIEARLQAAGVSVEHYPIPAKTGLGKCHRRPCGMDSAIITDEGVITDSIQQIRAYMTPPKTPSFQKILDACFDGLRRSYDIFLDEGESLAHTRMPDDDRKFLVENCLRTIEDVKEWARAGYPIDQSLISQVPKSAKPSKPQSQPDVEMSKEFETDLTETVVSEEFPEFFWRADLKAVAQSGQWVPFVRFLVENGIPSEDTFAEVILTLARWFGLVELFGEDRDRIKAVLTKFALTRHNNHVSRLLTGQDGEVVAHVGRIVDHVLDGEDLDGKRVFAEIRQKRATGMYRENYFFEGRIMRERQGVLPSTQVESLPFYLICGGLIPDSLPDREQSGWSYEPDDTPLPDEVMNRLRAAFKSSGRQLRRNKSTGRYPTLDAITRFFNYLFSGRKSGTRRAGKELIIKMGFPKKNSERGEIISVLLRNGLLHKGGYRAMEQSRQWFLDTSIVMAMHEDRQQKRNVS